MGGPIVADLFKRSERDYPIHRELDEDTVVTNGKRTVTHGPFADPKELVAGFALMRVRSTDEAIAWCDRFAAVIGDVDLFMGPVVEPWVHLTSSA